VTDEVTYLTDKGNQNMDPRLAMYVWGQTALQIAERVREKEKGIMTAMKL